MAISNEFKGDYEKAKETLYKSINIFINLGEVKGTSFSINVLIHQYYYTGDYHNMYSFIEQYLSYYNKTKDSYIRNSASVYKVQYFRETGELEKALECGNFIRKPSFEMKDSYNYCTMCIELGITYIEQGNTKNAIDYLLKAKEINENNSFFMQYTVLLYPYLAEAYMMEYMDVLSGLAHAQKHILINKIKKACEEALKKTERFPTHYGISLRVMARYQQLAKNMQRAEALYKKSIEICNTYNRKFEMGKSYYHYGMLLYSLINQRDAEEAIHNASLIFEELGAKFYIELCKRFLD
jgi:tetratricopeptide (TPR) repeat protein